jgi:hypothetical protein
MRPAIPRTIIAAVVLMLSAAPWLPAAECEIPPNYREAIDENVLMLVRTLGRLQSNRWINQNPELHGKLLDSMLRYHAGVEGTLPFCVEESNAGFVSALEEARGAVDDLLEAQAIIDEEREAGAEEAPDYSPEATAAAQAFFEQRQQAQEAYREFAKLYQEMIGR